MKYILVFITMFFVGSCQTISSKVENNSEKQISVNQLILTQNQTVSSIREIDFQNFTFPWTKTLGNEKESFTLKKGISQIKDGRRLSLESLSYIEVMQDFGEQALVTIKIDDGNATYQMLYVFAVLDGKPKLLERFEFGPGFANSLGTAFSAHGALVIETFVQTELDAECCPGIIEISYYNWHNGKFVLLGEPQKIANGYLERIRKRK